MKAKFLKSRPVSFTKKTCTVLFLLFGLAAYGQGIEYDYFPDVSYEEMEDRMACIPLDIPLIFNQRVKDFIDYFTIRNRDYTRALLNKKARYFDIFEPVLTKYDIPDELKYLAVVESGLRPDAVSRASAVGLWQFMASTGKMYGLRSNWFVDNRMDPYKATEAACRHLRDLYRMFGDWELAMAAYNSGPGNVRKAIRRSGYKRSFWEIYRYLPRETRSYVPQFTAVIYVMNYADEHNLFPTEEEYAMAFDTIMVSQYFHIETFARQLNVCLDDMLKLNPEIKRGALPEGTKSYSLRVPGDLKPTIVEKRSMLYDTASKVGRKELKYLARNIPGSTYGRVKTTYRVRRGDVLGTIARKYRVRVSDIKKWNGLRSSLIRIGQRLNIWTLPNYNSQTKDLYVSGARVTDKATPAPADKSTYKVQYGDTLWSISRRTNVSVRQLKQLNNLTSSRIRVGQSLIIGAKQ